MIIHIIDAKVIINGVEDDDHYPFLPLESGKGRPTSAIEKNQQLTIKVPTSEHFSTQSDNFGFPVAGD